MNEYTLYDPATGVILKTFSFQNADFIDQQDIGNAVLIEGLYGPEDFWINDGQPEQRQDAALSIPDSVNIGDDLSFTLPANTFFEIGGTRYSGEVTLPTNVVTIHYINLQGAYRGSYAVFVKSYVENRVAAYPSYGDQFDYIYHNGYDAWYQMITDIKNHYPKPS